jgi:3-oxoacyl-(acyl-carrier-protein) synthase/acyl carrier protein
MLPAAPHADDACSALVHAQAKPTGIELLSTAGTPEPDSRPVPTATASTIGVSLISPGAAINLAAHDVARSLAAPEPAVPDWHGSCAMSIDELENELSASLAQTLYINAVDIDPSETFNAMGLDSIVGVEWARVINEQYQVNLPATRLYDYPTVHALAAWLHPQLPDRHFPDEVNLPGPSLPTALAPIPPTVMGPLSEAAARREPPVSCHDASIAIIGMAGQFPQAENLNEYWRNIAQGRDCVSEVPVERWDAAACYDAQPQKPGKSCSRWMGVLPNADRFDPLFFGISPAEACSMDPQQRVFLQAAWQCMEDAAINPALLSGSRCGVFVGCGPGDYVNLHEAQSMTAQALMGASNSILSARIAYLLNLKGPCMAIDTACSSSLVAVAQACASLVQGGSDLAFAGGVCVLAGPAMHIMTSQAGMLSPDGKCYSFDARANGFVPGEGVGVVLLKRLDDALRDGDRIHGVLRGWGINQDGKTNGITAPSVNSQIALETGVYRDFGIDPSTIGLVEAHGTGTALGDPIEVEGLSEAFGHAAGRQTERRANRRV